jgi:Flp pilus assembly pilin Flp
MIRQLRSKRGQAMTEYIIIVAIIALAALAVFGLFGDRIRAMVGGATEELGGDPTSVGTAVGSEGDSLQKLKDLKPTGE